MVSRECSSYFLANEIFIGFNGVNLNPCRESLAAPACTSFSNSTNAMSCRPGTRRTSLKPGNLCGKHHQISGVRMSYKTICLTGNVYKGHFLLVPYASGRFFHQELNVYSPMDKYSSWTMTKTRRPVSLTRVTAGTSATGT